MNSNPFDTSNPFKETNPFEQTPDNNKSNTDDNPFSIKQPTVFNDKSDNLFKQPNDFNKETTENTSEDTTEELDLLAGMNLMQGEIKNENDQILTEEEKDELVKRINNDIQHYNILQKAINIKIREQYTRSYKTTLEADKKQREITEVGYDAQTEHRLDQFKKIISKSIEQNHPIPLEFVDKVREMMPDALQNIFTKYINGILASNEELMDVNAKISDTKHKKELIELIDKVSSTLAPRVKRNNRIQKYGEKLMKTQETKLRTKIESLKPVEDNLEAIYNITSVIEIIDYDTNVVQNRSYYNIKAVRVYQGATTLTADEYDEIYPKELSLKVRPSKFEFGVSAIIDNRVSERYKQLVEKITPPGNEVEIKEFIIKPINYKYNNALVTFTNPITLDNFINNMKEMVTKLKQLRLTSKDYIVTITANQENFGARYKTEIKENYNTYLRYTNEEISERLDKLAISYMISSMTKSDTSVSDIANQTLGDSGQHTITDIDEINKLRELQNSGQDITLETLKNMEKNTSSANSLINPRICHPYLTPTRKIFLSVMQKYTNEILDNNLTKQSEMFVKVFEDNKQEIVIETLQKTIPYILNLSNTLMQEFENKQEGKKAAVLHLTPEVVADLSNYGEPVNGIIPKYFKARVKDSNEVKVLTYAELIKDTSKINSITLSEMLGRTPKIMDLQGAPKIIKYNGRGKTSEKLNKLFKELKIEIDMGNVSDVENIIRRSSDKMIKKSIQIDPITESNVDEYLRNLIGNIIEHKNINIRDLDIDYVIKSYKRALAPLNKDVKDINVYNWRLGTNIIKEPLTKTEMKVKSYMENINISMIKNGNTNNDIIVKEAIKSKELSKIIDNPKWENVEINGDLLDDLIESIKVINIVPNMPKVISTFIINMPVQNINEYVKYTLQDNSGLITPITEVIPQDKIDINIESVTLDMIKDIKEVISSNPVHILRDITILNGILNKPSNMRKLERAQKTDNYGEMVDLIKSNYNTINEDEITVKIPTINDNNEEISEVTYNTHKLFEAVDDILNTISITHIEKILYKNSMLIKRMYNNRNKSKTIIEKKFEGYYYEPNQIEEIINIQDLMGWITCIGILPVQIIIELGQYKDKLEKELKSQLPGKDFKIESEREIQSKTRTMAAYYKTYLKTGDKKFLDNIDRNYVDFELLTQDPSNNSPGGEYSIPNMIDTYNITDDELEDYVDSHPFLSVILLAEKKNPDLKNQLPLPIINHIENEIEIISDFEDLLKVIYKDTKFNINHKKIKDSSLYK